MWQRSSGLVAEDVCQFLQSDLDFLSGIVVVGEIGRVAPGLLKGKRQSQQWHRARGWTGHRTRSWPYSFSKRRRRLTGSLAASRLLFSAKGVFAISLDHWVTAQLVGAPWSVDGSVEDAHEVHGVCRGMSRPLRVQRGCTAQGRASSLERCVVVGIACPSSWTCKARARRQGAKPTGHMGTHACHRFLTLL